ncbi:antibiotic biosynthesis monooxygenase family protein [Nonomuraea sp. NPDC047897]|uniref:antibiotic biosynthesis monooxygenase family protein n=1 Tax=Nonomuraea sp. NPDC047897 TaxID=3364346 RepID=UPI00372255B3
MIGHVRVLVYYAAPEQDQASVLEAYRRVSDGMRGTPGLLSSQLLRSALDTGEFAVLSEWTDLPRFRAWEEGTRHKQQTAALRSYRDEGRGRGYGIYEVVDQL